MTTFSSLFPASFWGNLPVPSGVESDSDDASNDANDNPRAASLSEAAHASSLSFSSPSPSPLPLSDDEDEPVPPYLFSLAYPHQPFTTPSFVPSSPVPSFLPPHSPSLQSASSTDSLSLPAPPTSSSSPPSTSSSSSPSFILVEDDDPPSPADDEVEIVRANLKRPRSLPTLEERRQRRRLQEEEERRRRLTDGPSGDDEADESDGDRRSADASEVKRPEDVVDLTADPHPAAAHSASEGFLACVPLHPLMAEAPEVREGARTPEPPVHICPVCAEEMKEMASTKCGHAFCLSCVHQAIKLNKRCPTCRAPAKKTDVRRLYL